MKKLEIKYYDPNNKEVIISKPITNFNEEHYNSLILQIKEISLKEKAYAMAAPQFGIYERFILIMTPEEMTNKQTTAVNYCVTPYFNPIITETKGKQEFYEACISVPGAIGKVVRPYLIELEAQNIKGEKIHRTIEGFEAIIFCHEIDHLNGIEYLEKATDIMWGITYDDKIMIRKEHPHTIISKDCVFENTYSKT